MPEGNITHGVTGAETMGWSVTVKPTSATQGINGFWLVHSGDDCTIQTWNNPTAVPASGTTLNPSLNSSGSKDGWTFLYLDSNNNLWCNNDFLEGTDSGSCDLPDPKSEYTNLTITITPGTPDDNGKASLSVEWSYDDPDKENNPQTGSISLGAFQNINALS